MSELEILYRDRTLIAINKPSGLLVHRSLIDKRETRFAMQQLRDQIGQRVYPLHRLDKPTSGVLLFALSSEAARLAQPVFRARNAQKTYLAAVRGWTEDEGVIDYPLSEERDATTDPQNDSPPSPKEAITTYRTLARIELPYTVGRYPTARYALIEARPQTGRKHQIRRHLKHLFHPLIGDTTHGDSRHNRFFRQQFSIHRLLLHAWRLTFEHPVTGDPIQLTAPPDSVWHRVVELFGHNPFGQEGDRPNL